MARPTGAPPASQFRSAAPARLPPRTPHRLGTPSHRLRAILCGGPVLALALASCSAPRPVASFDTLDPADRVRAALLTENPDDRRALAELVVMLDSDDPAQRLIASARLRHLTGRSFGYDHAAPEPERRAAADLWAAWVADGAARSKATHPLQDTVAAESIENALRDAERAPRREQLPE